MLGHPMVQFFISLGVSQWESKRAKDWAPRSSSAMRTVRKKRMSEQCELRSKWTSTWPSTFIPVLGCFEPLCGFHVVWIAIVFSSSLLHRSKKHLLLAFQIVCRVFFPLSCGTSKRSRDSTHWLGVWPGLMSFCFTVSTTHWSSGTIGSNHWPLAASQGPMLAGYKWPHEQRFMTIAFRRHLRNKSISISTVKVASCYMPFLFSNSHQIQKETFVYLTKV